MRLNKQAPTNPLDAKMTRTQVVRRRFKSGLPRVPQNRELSKMEALARTADLFDKLRAETKAAGLDVNKVSAGLVYYQPQTKGAEHVLFQTIVLPKPEGIGKFVEQLMALDKPLFLGLLFLQEDPDAESEKYKNVAFVWPFMSGPEAEGRLLAAIRSQAKGGSKKTAN